MGASTVPRQLTEAVVGVDVLVCGESDFAREETGCLGQINAV